HRTLKYIRQLGAKAGVVLNPATPVDILDWVMDDIDLVLIMSVNPGFGGQSFIESQLRKIETVRKKLDAVSHPAILQVDGGVNAQNAGQCVDAGATALVAGSAVFKGGREAYAGNISALKGPISEGLGA
ncbi:MAG: ribulose-phosphate 3-epimerase, partial [Asticcacaulis sp.]|nr:ribulose-phosphate 3-epimerase [Asticcacaulis sp.]